ncbi:MAG: GerMN domain-containing protein [Peptococcaceae bacterium]|nr:GerMN domain-containing protein [Peptococcaceae bacterium]
MEIFRNRHGIRAMAARIIFFLLMLAMLCPAPGCGGRGAVPSPGQSPPPAGPDPKETPVRVTLYFSDSQARWLVPEVREVAGSGVPVEQIVVRELIRGPAVKGLQRTIPEGTRLISLNVANGVARVNFSREFQARHWGGSAGETFTIYSVVNSLTELEGIKKVEFLVEGKRLESLAGHMDLTGPVEPDRSLIKK